MKINPNYTVLIPLYINDNPQWIQYSIDSILAQTITPEEIFIMKDGPITIDAQQVIDNYLRKYPELFTIDGFEINQGLGKALAYGVVNCRNELIARMDADDYAVPERCEKQLLRFEKCPELDVIGSNVEEFIVDVNNVISHVIMPKTNEEIIKFAKKRCPIRHPSLMYRKSAVLEAGNYRDYRHAQDYNLVVHMILSGAKFYNIQENLVYMRVTSDFYNRRGGIKQFKLVLRLKKEFLNYGFYSVEDFIISALGNAIVCLMPNFMRKFVYTKFLRK